MRLGYLALALIAFRLCWGVLGNRYARFSAWWPAPSRLRDYLVALRSPDTPVSAGHSPLGGLATWVLLVLVSIQAATGLFADDEILYTGPYAGALSGGWSDWLNDLHHSHFDWLLAAVVLHVLAITAYRVLKGHRLVRAMVTGRAPVAPQAEAHTPPLWRILLAIVIAVGALWLLLQLAPEPSLDDYFY